jgi:FdhD protein
MNRPSRPGSTVRAVMVAVSGGRRRRRTDLLATEEPMELRVVSGGATHPICVTMRTPGHDFELAAGFLFSEGAIRSRADIARISYCSAAGSAAGRYNTVHVHVRPGAAFDATRFSRHVLTSSSCGVCGKTLLEQLRAMPRAPVGRAFTPDETMLPTLPGKLQSAQAVFARTGGLHAAGLFDARGELLLLREDVGRHNAMDKLVGALLLGDKLPAADTIVVVSGRASFELVQKAATAGIPALAAVGAPSSLAVDLARESGMTLIGFLRDDRFNVYVARE